MTTNADSKVDIAAVSGDWQARGVKEEVAPDCSPQEQGRCLFSKHGLSVFVACVSG